MEQIPHIMPEKHRKEIFMVYYITDGINYLSSEDPDSTKMTKDSGCALKFASETRAFPVLLAFRSKFPQKAQMKWRIEARDEEYTEPIMLQIKCERGYLANDLSLTSNPAHAGKWEEEKAKNVLNNQCSTHPLLRKYTWMTVPIEEDDIPDPLPEEISYTDIDPAIYSENAPDMLALIPFAQPSAINSSLGLIHALVLFYDGIGQREKALNEECRKTEKLITIIEHAIEFNEYDDTTEHKLIQMIRCLRRRRRKCKDELVVTHAFLNNISPELVSKAGEYTQILEGRYYMPEMLAALFKDSDNTLLKAQNE